ncbi:hypothetical protein NLX67_20765 [Domibacillus sp. A3M-37]|uniref:hypothetical protein n=1 Tax=Domibacillus sp. A3M-37 TaxID=2962037 RepID=UPI0020B70B93|nr:hypothetical protein [Domibacillus sp. A3M-37]MCP3764766.1 hypothetical protein [Domibacillus sp. A3M-37]
MKIMGVSLLMTVLLGILSLSIDVLSGFDVATSIRNSLNPFYVMETAELVIFVVFLFFIVAGPVLSFFRKRKEEAVKDKK